MEGIDGVGDGVDGEVDVAVAVDGLGEEPGAAALIAFEAPG